MTYTYKTRGTCSTQIDLELEGNIVHKVHRRLQRQSSSDSEARRGSYRRAG